MENISYLIATIFFFAQTIFFGSILNESFMEKDFNDVKTMWVSLGFGISFLLGIFFASCVNFQ